MSKKLTNADFLNKYSIKHDIDFVEPITEYSSMRKMTGYICNICGNVFGSLTSNYKQKHLCSNCSKYLRTGNKKETTSSYEEKAKAKRDEEYLTIFAVDYKKSTDYVYAYCNICGNLFKNRADQILNKSPECKICGNHPKVLNDDIVRWNLNLVYGYDNKKLDFSHLNYKDGKVTIGCYKHGDYRQDYYWATLGNGCPVCSQEEESRQAKLLGEYLDSNGYNPIREHKFDDLIDEDYLRLDFYLPQFNTVIEYNGTQHYMPKSFGSCNEDKVIENFKKTKKHDKMKEEYCKKKGINFFTISYKDDTIKKAKEILKEVENENIEKKC